MSARSMARAEPPAVLLVAYYFPPRGEIAAQRAGKFARYLPDFGWRPVVLTSSRIPEDMRDETLGAGLPPDLQVLRAPLVGFDHLQSLGRRWLGWWMARRVVGRRQRRPSIRARARWLLFPDDKAGWLPAAVWHGRKLIKQHGISAIFSTSSPATAHLIGWWLSRLSGRPWIADFRDPWAGHEGLYFPSRAHRSLARATERALVNRASLVTAPTDAMTEVLCRAHDHLPRHRFVTIPNGFDPEDFSGPAHRATDVFTLVHAGSFKVFVEDRRRTPVFLFRALQQWLERVPGRRGEVRVELLGPLEAYLRELVDAQGLAGVVHPVGYLNHRAALARMVAADVLILVMGEDERTSVPAKLYEYVAAGRPVLALVPEGPAARMVRETRCGVVVPPREVAQIVPALERFYTQRGVSPPPVPLDGLTRRESARRLAEQLNTLVGKAPAQVAHQVVLDR